MAPLGKIHKKKYALHFHYHADDTKLYLSMKTDETHQSANIQSCLKEIKNWMCHNFSMLSFDKNEVPYWPEYKTTMIIRQPTLFQDSSLKKDFFNFSSAAG